MLDGEGGKVNAAFDKLRRVKVGMRKDRKIGAGLYKITSGGKPRRYVAIREKLMWRFWAGVNPAATLRSEKN